MTINEIKTPEDVLTYMKEHIKYGWIDINGDIHVGNLKNFRNTYRISTLEETIEHGVGTCIEQVVLMKYLLSLINIPSKMYCTRIYEGEEYHKPEEDEHMHCFILYFENDTICQIEHPDWDRAGLYTFESEEAAIRDINKIYKAMSGGEARPVVEFDEAPTHISYREFNLYINNIEKEKTRTRK